MGNCVYRCFNAYLYLLSLNVGASAVPMMNIEYHFEN